MKDSRNDCDTEVGTHRRSQQGLDLLAGPDILSKDIKRTEISGEEFLMQGSCSCSN